MAEVILSNFVDDKLDNLIDILFQKEYFGFRSDAKIYVDALYTFIYTIPQKKRPDILMKFFHGLLLFVHARSLLR